MEADLQKFVVARIKNIWPDLIFWHTQNNSLTARRGKHSKEMGVLAGVPDLFFPTLSERGVFVELKLPRTKNKSSVTQRKQERLQRCLTEAGFDVYVLDSAQDVLKLIRGYMHGSGIKEKVSNADPSY